MDTKIQIAYEEKPKTLFSVGKEYCEKGLSVLPTDEKKRATVPWKVYQTNRPSEEELYKMFAKVNSICIGVITGKVSDNLEVIDVDVKYDITGVLYEQLCSTFLQQQPELFEKLFKVKTKSGGFHWYYRCSYIQGNQKLASRSATEKEIEEDPHDKVKVLIETRGEGGYVIAPPSAGYEFVDEEEYNIIEITPQERDYIIWLCRSFNEHTEEAPASVIVKKQKKNYSITPWDDYNERGQDDMIERLTNHGWQIVKTSSEKIIFKRPGKTESVSSGDFCYKLNLFTVFTTSSIFEAQKGYKPSGVFAMLECGGDWRTVSKKLSELGYGQKKVSDDDVSESQQSAFEIMQEHFAKEKIYKNIVTRFCEVNGNMLNEQALNSHFISLIEQNKKLKGLTKPNFDIFINSENIHSKNPIKDYLEGLPGTKSTEAITSLVLALDLKIHERFEKFAAAQFTKPTHEFVATLITKWLIGVVAGVYEGNYNPLMIVLIGPKNTGKTEFFRRLLPEPLKQYFAQSKFNDGKDSEALMCEKLLTLNDELDGMNRNDAKTFRNFISQDYYTYRPPYGKQNITVKRLSSVCGTSNEIEIINDPENNRRIIPIEITGIDYSKYNSINKEQLFAEVYSLYKACEQWNLSSGEITLLDEFMKGYKADSVEREMIQNLFIPGDADNSEVVQLSAGEIMKEINEWYTHARLNKIKIGKELTALGFKQRPVRKGLTVVRAYDCIRLNKAEKLDIGFTKRN